MSFLNWILLGGVAGLAAPLIIHLLNRTRFQVVDWGAMHLLDQCTQVNSRRIHWQELILLLLRCLIPVLLAFALARPVLTSLFAHSGGSGNKSTLVLLDHSLSMDAPSRRTDQNCLQSAINQATEFIQKQSAGCEIGVWTIGGTTTDIVGGMTSDKRRSLMALRSIRGSAGSVPANEVLTEALATISSRQNLQREIVVVSDFQSQDWQQISQTALETIKAQLGAANMPLQLSFLQVERSEDPVANLAISVELLEQTMIVAGQSFRIGAVVHNRSSVPVENAQVRVQMANQSIGDRKVSVPANGVTQVTFECTIDTAGPHELTFSVDDPNGISGDNVAFHVAQVRSPLRVLLVDDRADASEFERPSGYLALALAPFQGVDAAKNIAQCKTVRPNQFRPTDLDQYDIVILANVSRLADDVATAMQTFVSNGGNLILFSGEQMDLAWYNSRWGTKQSEALLPFNFTMPKPDFAKQTQISVSPIQKSTLSALERAIGSDVATWKIEHWSPLDNVAKNEATDQNARKIIEFANGSPLLAERTIGKGRVLQFAISPDAKWTNLPNRPSFVPLLHSLVHWLVTESDIERNMVTGQAIAIDRMMQAKVTSKPQSNAPAIDIAKQQTVSIEIPGKEQKITFSPMDDGTFAETSRPGIYRVTQDGQSGKNESFAVNLPPNESVLDVLDSAQLQLIGETAGATISKSADELLAIDNLRSNGREVWRWVLMGLVVLIFAELWLQQRISKVTP